MAILGPGDNLLLELLHRHRDEEKKREKREKMTVTSIHIGNFYYPTTRGRGGENSGLFLSADRKTTEKKK